MWGSVPPDSDDVELPASATSAPALQGSPDEMVAEMKKYGALGTSQLIFHCHPYSEAALEMLTGVVANYRASAAH